MLPQMYKIFSRSDTLRVSVLSVLCRFSSSHNGLLHPDGLVGVGTLRRQTRIDASLCRLLLWVVGRHFVGWGHPQSAIQDGQNDAIKDKNPVQDVTHAHVPNGLGRAADQMLGSAAPFSARCL